MAKKKEPAAFALLAYIDELVEDLRGNVPKAMKQWDADAIHDARVATRRLKAALDLLEPVLSDEHLKPFSKVLKKLRRRLGPMRDFDVMIDHLAELKTKAHAPAIAWLSGQLHAQRETARKESEDHGPPARVLSRLGAWWGLREEVGEAHEAADTLLAESLHGQLDSFAESADRLAGQSKNEGGEAGERQDPHAVRIAGKSFRYTLEMAEVQGHKLPSGVMRRFKRMQEELGLWHDYVVLTERAMQVSLQTLLPHHDAPLQAGVMSLARLLLNRSSRHLAQFASQWAAGGAEVADAIRSSFPLAKSISESKKDPDPPGSDGSPVLAPAAPDGPSAEPA